MRIGNQDVRYAENAVMKSMTKDHAIRAVSKRIVLLTSLEMKRGWQLLYRKLDSALKDRDIVVIEMDYSNVREQAYRMLMKWIRDNREGATFRALVDGLKSDYVDRGDVAEKISDVCRHYRVPDTEGFMHGMHVVFKTVAPGAPGAPEVVKTEENYVDLTWQKPVKDGGNKIIGYQVDKRKVGAPNWEKANDYNISTTSFMVSNLQPGAEYEFRVAAINNAGVGEFSSATMPVKVIDKDVALGAPGAPEVVKTGENYVDLTWQKPVKDGGNKIIGYQVDKRKVGGWEKANDYNISTTSFMVSNLQPGAEYEFRVAAINNAGVGEFSSATMPVKVIDKDDKDGMEERRPRPSFEAQFVNFSKERVEASKNCDWDIGLRDIINRHSSRLFVKHSNLNVISASPVKSQKEGNCIITCTCIVLYCKRKGLIPNGEDHFPACLEGVQTDVREGYFQFSQPPEIDDIRVVYDSKHYHNPLKVGGSISREGDNSFGTLGCFVEDIDNQEVKGFLTCCHVLFKQTPQPLPENRIPPTIKREIDRTNKERTLGGAYGGAPENRPILGVHSTAPSFVQRPGEQSHILPDRGDRVVQPSDRHFRDNRQMGQDTGNSQNNRICGEVERRLFEKRYMNNEEYFVDAAFVKVTNRDIQDGEFVLLKDEVFDMIKLNDQLPITLDNFNLNVTDPSEVSELGKNLVMYKCGCSTGITKGELHFFGAAVRYFNMDGVGGFEAKNVIEMVDYVSDYEPYIPFAQGGDSGSVVFAMAHENGENKVKILGLFLGQTVQAKSYLVSPIKPILHHLNVRLRQFPE